MGGDFAALMAESYKHTQAVSQQAQVAIASRERKEADRKREQEEREKKERELEIKIRQRHFEEMQREKERQERQEKEREQLARRLQEKEREREEKFLGRAGSNPRKGTASSSRLPRRNGDLDADGDDLGATSALALTREEKRARRMADGFRLSGASKRSFASTFGTGAKGGRRLAGGAINVVGSLNKPSGSLAHGSRLASSRELQERIADSNVLIPARTVKRDHRTIDEHMRDKANANGHATVLDGDSARNFGDWFGSKSKSSASKPDTPSRRQTPPDVSPSAPPKPRKAGTPHLPSSAPSHPPASRAASHLPAASTSAPRSFARQQPPETQPLGKSSKAASTHTKKRPRASHADFYDSEPEPLPRKKPRTNSIVSEIWQAVTGRSRESYVSRGDLSDDSDGDMEASALDVEREEKKSARLARQEDLEAEEQERRRLEEKQRRLAAKADPRR